MTDAPDDTFADAPYRDRRVPRGAAPAGEALSRAVTLMTVELERAAAEHRRLADEAALALSRRRQLHAAVERALEALPAEARAPHARRIAAALVSRRRLPGGQRRPDSRAEAARWFLAHLDDRVFRTAELTQWLNQHDWPVTPKEAAATLKDLFGQGYVVQVRKGSYRAVSSHPVLVEIKFRIIEGMMES